MPRGSFKPEDALKGGFAVEGNFEVVKSVVSVCQLPPNKAGKQSAPFTALVWQGYKLDENWKRPEDAEIQIANFRIGMLEDFRPGQLTNPDDLDEEPEDLGREAQIEGNALYAEQGKAPFADSAFIMLISSLEKPGGFKPSVIARACATDFEGMKLHLKVVNQRTYEDKETGEKKTPTTSVCDQAISVFPYDKPKKAGLKAVGKTVGKVAVMGKDVSPPQGAPGQSQNGTDPMEIATALVQSKSDRFSKMCPADKAVKRGVFQMQVSQDLLAQKVDKALHPAIIALVKDDEQLMELGASCGFLVDLEAGTITFQGE